jgi:UDP-3-O-[3-hydroxymyristoyl] glucosamine N-acyltransferase
MHPSLFFKSNQIIRERDFFFTYAMGQDLEKSIAYANDLKSLNLINSIPTISVIITHESLVEEVSESKGAIVSDNPQKEFFLLHNFMVKENHIQPLNDSHIDETAIISPTSKIGDNVVIGKNVVINDYAIIEANTIIGDDCEIEPFVVIGAKSMQRTIIDEQLIHLEYAGGVKIGNRSRILTGAIIQKPYQAFYTTIGNDSVISTKVVIGHGSKVGNRSLLSGNSAIAGNCIIGDDVWIGGGAMVSDGIQIEHKAKVLLGSVVIQDVKSQSTVSGNFAFDHKKNIKHYLNLKQ